MSKQFERLYHAWVLEFRERYLRWAHPKARPWEHTCRKCDGTCGTKDYDLVLCDHCDAMYGFKCLEPPLKKLPTGIWHCPDCKPKLQSVKGVRMMSAISEQAARKRAELGDTPKRKLKQTMYLVKWSGLGYEYCTWETKDDIGNTGLIAQYKKLNNSFPDEPDMPEEVVDKFLSEVKHINSETAGGKFCIPDLRKQLYAQTRAFEFTKFGMEIPDKVSKECGPKMIAGLVTPDKSDDECHPKEVVECVSDLVYRVSYKDSVKQLMKESKSLPPLLTGEYDAVVPITSKGLMMNVGEIHGSVAFLGYRTFPDGTKGPAEINKLIRNVGDKIIAVDGVSTVNKSFKEVINLLRESGKNKYAFMRFLATKYAVCRSDLASVGSMGRYAIEELSRKFSTDRRRLLAKRIQNGSKDDDEDGKAAGDDAARAENSDEESFGSEEGDFDIESDDEDMRGTSGNIRSEVKGLVDDQSDDENPPKPPTETITKDNDAEEKKASDQEIVVPPTSSEGIGTEKQTDIKPDSPDSAEKVESLVIRPETTQSLAFRLLNIDVDYSSDEGGDEDCAFYVDGVDETYTAMSDIPEEIVEATKAVEEKKKPEKKKASNEDANQITLPVRRSDFVTLGDRSKMVASVALTSCSPDTDDFDKFPFPSTKEIEAQKAKEKEAQENAEAEKTDSPGKPIKRSTVKVEQISTSTNETIHVWANVESAAATLQIPLNELREILRGEYDEVLGDEVGGFRWRYAAAGATVTAGESKNKSSKKGKEAWLEFKDKLYDPSEPHLYKNENRLRDYQVEGVNWLASTYYRKHGCILADEMGLGKTVQIVSYLEHLHRVEKIHRPFLVVVPLSTVEHWRREFEGWTDMVCCIYHDRQRVWRDVLREYEWYFEDRPHTADYLKFDVLVTTYDTLIGDFDVISQIPFRAAVVDEAHRLRNQKGKLLECMKEISAKGTLQYGFQSRVLMSGTPLQNDLIELWTLLNFIEPFKFPDLDQFMMQFGNMANKEQVEALQQKISPFMLRRVKEDVAKDIPAKEETVIDVELTSIQKQYYRAIFEHNHAFLNMGSSRSNAPKLMNIQMELRKVCNHPCLLDGVEHREQDNQFKIFLENGDFEGKTPEEQQKMLNEHLYIMTSGKMVLMDKLLPKLRQEGHKVLIFSQMVKMLDLISEYCEFRNFNFERLDGRVRGADRQKAIDRFEREKSSFLFLLSTRAGGVGINLTAADICIIFDSDWNPQNDVQAQARCHRIGQTKDVRIYRLITSRTFEQEMFDRASKKLGLEQAVLGTFNQDDDDDKPTSKEMEQLLKKGAYALLEDENDEIGKAFCADDIENILAKRTRTRVMEGTKTASWLNKQGMVVSKSKFTSDSKSADLDMDDPLFWQKIMPDFVTPALILQKLQELDEEITGTAGKGKGRGRGRGRWKNKQKDEQGDKKEGEQSENQIEKKEGEQSENQMEKKEGEQSENQGKEDTVENAENGDTADNKEMDGKPDESEPTSKTGADSPSKPGDGGGDDDASEEKEFTLTRTQIKKVSKFMSDLKSMMQGVFDDAEDDSLSNEDKSTCQKLLLTISVKEKLFNDEQRHIARSMLKRLEGNRRRRCRTSDQPQPDQFSPGRRSRRDEAPAEIREELRIVGKQKKKRRKKGEGDRRRKSYDEDLELGDDGYLVHSDDEADWSDVAEDLYLGGKKKATISRKEANRRRQWAAGDDAATAAGRAWPVFPRTMVSKVLGALLDEVLKHDDAKGGVFSEPVERSEYPEYFEQIKHPMDYATMKKKLEKGEYRSAQAMQKDFVLVMQNCLKFNAADSEIVLEARQQALMRPNLLRNAAMKFDLFLAEDGSVLEILDDDAKKKAKESDGTPKKRRRRKKSDGVEKTPTPRKGKKSTESDGDEDAIEEGDVPLQSLRKKKPRITISLGDGGVGGKDKSAKKKPGKRGRPPKHVDGEIDDGDDVYETPIPRKKRRKAEGSESVDDPSKRRGRKKKGMASEPSTPEDALTKESGKANGSAKRSGKKKKKGKKVDDTGPGAYVEMTDNEEHVSAVLARRTSRTSDSQNDKDSIFLKAEEWEEGRKRLDSTFASARSHFEKEGPWKLPSALDANKFKDVANLALSKVNKCDRYSIFVDAVDEKEAPGYYEIVKNPIDMAKMKKKVDAGQYGDGSEGAAQLYEDFLLMFDNCSLYNDDDGEVIEEATRVFTFVPEIYAQACTSILKKQQRGA